MRRTLVAAVVAVATALTVGPAPTARADDTFVQQPVPEAPAPATSTPAEEASAALATVQRLLRGDASARRTSGEPDLTLAMRDLYVALPRLDADERAEAEALLARPTAGVNDRNGDGYTVPSARKCGGNFCVHYVTSTEDAAPSASWVNYTLKQMNKVWKTEVKKLGYRKPLPDTALGSALNGGNGKFDIYLTDLGSRGLYGYCAPEAGLRGAKYKFRAISYCVLDNDFSPAQFGTAPKPTLQVTAAHEFFHAVQFSYDYGEDRWLLESSATWMEERFADNVNDNRQYLPASQVAAPWAPLDTFAGSGGSNQYGNWVFWEYLSRRFGQDIVQKVWEGTAPHGRRNSYAIATVKKLMKSRGGFEKVYADFAAGNAFPAKSYQEGKAWPSPALAADVVLSKAKPGRSFGGSVQVAHLASAHARVRPDRSLGSKKWKLKVQIDGPSRSASPAAVVTVQSKGGKLTQKLVKLNRKGKGQVKVPFSRKKVRGVTATAVNASTRFGGCYSQDAVVPQYSCSGVARDDASVFTLRFKVVK